MERRERMSAYHCEEDVVKNLRDAGCDEATIQAFMNDLHSGKPAKGTKLLEKHRRSLLDHLHAEQKKIDCLDYLLFALQKQRQPQKTYQK